METHFAYIALGALLLVGLLTDEIGRATRLPRVTLLILFGLLAGPAMLDILPGAALELRETLTTVALSIVAFLLGGALRLKTLRLHGRAILAVSLMVALITAVVVGAGLLALGAPMVVALLLAGVSTSTDPAATQDVVRQTNARGPFTSVLLGVVAVDDAWGVILFSAVLVLAKSLAGDAALDALAHGAIEIFGAVAVGVAVGLPAAFLTGRLRPGEPILAEALGVVFLCAGLAIWIGASFLLAGIVAGTLVANLASHHQRAFHEIEHIEWPFMVVFFVLAGASLSFERLGDLGLIGVGYLVFRVLGRLLGGWLGGRAGGLNRRHRGWIGAALTPQAGVALGMALVAGDAFPQHADDLLAVAVGATVLFELFGPLLTRAALERVGEERPAPARVKPTR